MKSFIKQKNVLNSLILLLLTITIFSCQQKKETIETEVVSPQKIEMVTTQGTMVIALYDQTPFHRDNFVNLIRNKAFDSLLFHRVINQFMIQGGDPDSRNSSTEDTLGNGDAPYTVPAEFRADLFHKKGVLAAARDETPAKASSAMQFYIVHGRVFSDSLLAKSEVRINKNMAVDFYRKKNKNKSLLKAMATALDSSDFKTYYALKDSIWNRALVDEEYITYRIPENQREVYKTIGGTPHLDQNYTVFGEVISGIEVVDSIAKVETSTLDRPLVDVRILSVRMLE